MGLLLILNTNLCVSYSEASASGVHGTKGCARRQDGHAALPGEGGLSPASLQLVPQRRTPAQGLPR